MSTKTMNDAPSYMNQEEAAAWLVGYTAAIREISRPLGAVLANLKTEFEESEDGVKIYQKIQEWRKNA